MMDKVTWLMVGVLYIAILYILVRPGGKGVSYVEVITGTFADLVRGVLGQTFDSGTGKWSSSLWLIKGCTRH